MNKYLLLTVVAGGIIIIDQTSKYAVQHIMALHDYINIIPGFFNLTYIQNPGAAFGLFGKTTDTLRSVLLIGISLVALLILFLMYAKVRERDLLLHTSIALIIGGAIGNLIDRIRLQWVIDFLDFYWDRYHWPAFNLADAAITIGTLVLMFHILFLRKEIKI